MGGEDKDGIKSKPMSILSIEWQMTSCPNRTRRSRGPVIGSQIENETTLNCIHYSFSAANNMHIPLICWL